MNRLDDSVDYCILFRINGQPLCIIIEGPESGFSADPNPSTPARPGTEPITLDRMLHTNELVIAFRLSSAAVKVLLSTQTTSCRSVDACLPGSSCIIDREHCSVDKGGHVPVKRSDLHVKKYTMG